MRHFAIVGSGPAGFYTAEALAKAYAGTARVDILDRYPVPYGLIRFGVAPDHQSIKAVSRRYDKVVDDGTGFIGNVTLGRDVTIAEMLELYDAVVLATGAPNDRKLGIEGEELANVFGSGAFVGWYNGHPEFAALDPDFQGCEVAIIGAGNVALDCARILSKNEAEFEGSDIVAHALAALDSCAALSVTILARRGPHQIAMTPKELGELAHLAETCPKVDLDDFPPLTADEALDPGLRKSITLLRSFAELDCSAKPKSINFDFFAKPLRIEGEGKAERLVVERTMIKDGKAVGTGETYIVPASLVISCIGYSTPPIEGVPYDERAGRFANDDGRIADNLYCVGWARRGPTGTIGTNRPDGYEVADRVVAAMPPGSDGGKAGSAGLKSLLGERGVMPTDYADWRMIEEAEAANARPGSPREKFVRVEHWLGALSRG